MLQFHHRVRLVLLCCSLAGCFAPAASHAQTFEVLRPGFFQAGNRWEFSSISGTLGFATTWEIVAVSGTPGTVILRETARPGAPYYVDDLYVTLDSVAMQMSKLYETQYNPTLHIEVTYTPAPGLPKLPRVVNKTDSNRLLGRADSAGHVVENPTQTWTSHQDQFVTFSSTQTISVPAGSFSDCVTFRVTENWRYTDGWTGVAWRDFAISRHAGPVKMAYYVWDFYPDGSLYNYSTITHALVRFVPAIPDLVPSQGHFTPIATLPAGTTVTVSWHEDSLYQASGAHVSDVYLSTDTVITSRDIRLARKSVQALSAYGAVSLSAASAIPSGVATGAYYVAIVTDSLNQITEWNKANNTYLIPGKLNIVAKPDLTPAINSFSPLFLLPGSPLTVTATIRNIGGLPAPRSFARVYLSTDRTITTSDYLVITGIPVPPLDPQSYITFTRSGPASVPLGEYYVGVMCDATGLVEELSENNNTAASTQKVIIGRPDLFVAGGSFSPGSVRAGQPITISATIQNASLFEAQATSAAICLSRDNVITTTDTILWPLLPTAGLTSGSLVTITGTRTIPLTTASGSYYVGVICDVNRQVAESYENNNALALPGRLTVTAPLPDLRADQGSFTPSPVGAGQAVTVTWREVSQNGNSPAHRTSVYLSTDTLITNHDAILIYAKQMPPIPANQLYATSAVTLVPRLPTGQYYVAVKVDVWNQVVESDETNNTFFFGGLLTVVAEPDLRADQGSFTPPTVPAGGSLSINWRETCFYQPSAQHATSVYLSTDTLITNRDTLLVNAKQIPALGANQSYLASASATIPPNLSAGMYYVGVVVDVFNQVAEYNETNNTLLCNGRLTVLARPDLAPVSVSASPGLMRPGQLLTIMGTIRNIGGTAASMSLANIYLSTDTLIGGNDHLLLANIWVPQLDPGTQYQFSRSTFVPSPFPNGNYYVGIICDSANAIVEGNENNNTLFSAQPVTIGLPDLAVTGGSYYPHAVRPDDGAVSLQATIQNSGVFTADATSASIYLSRDSTITASDTVLLAGLPCPALTSGSVFTITLPALATTTTLGTYYVGVICDVGHKVVESNESNNVRALPGTLLVTTATADLRVEGLDFSPIVLWRGDPIRFSGSIVNDGLATTQNFQVGFYIRQADSSASRPLCAAVSVPPMAGNGDRFPLNTLARTVLGSVTSGTYTVGINIDEQKRIPETDKTNNTAWVHGKRLYVTPLRRLEAQRWELYR
jgi:subtilase family serine protease